MARMNGRTRKMMYPFLVERDGEDCQLCRMVGNRFSLIIDHKDNNNDNNEPDNLQLLHRGCNHRKNPRGKAKPKERNAEILPSPSSLEMYVSQLSKPVFLKWLSQQVNKAKEVEFTEVLLSGAKITGRSQLTIRRWLDVECSNAGIYRIIDVDGIKYVTLKNYFLQQ